MRRVLIAWSVVIAVMAALFTAAVLVLNATLFSASGFAGVYLDSLARGDARGALRLPGVDVPEGARTDLLTDRALAAFPDARIVRESDAGAGVRAIEIEIAATADTPPVTTTLLIEPAAPVLGVFAGWRFAQSPIAVLAAEPLHADAFEVNGVGLTAETAVPLAALTPGRYTLTHDSPLFTAVPVEVALTQPGTVTAAAIDIQASPRFVEQVQRELDAYLDECTQQTVLLPAGCPFGQQISNRVESEPVWSMVSHPRVVIVPGAERGTWRMPPTEAIAHLTVEVRSLFDGTRSTFDEDVPFTVAYDIRMQSDGRLLITAVAG